MLDITHAIKKEIRVTQETRGRRHRTHYVFQCKCDGCVLTFRATKSDLHKRSGFCKRCTKKGKIYTKPFLGRYNYLKYNARKHHADKEFDISYEQFLFLTQIGVCHYCGKANIDWHSRSQKSNLDRKDNTKGYTFENVVVCCGLCNFMKREWLSYEEFKIIALLLRRWREGTLEDRQELEYMLSAWNMQISFK
jgi:hypothetical protein